MQTKHIQGKNEFSLNRIISQNLRKSSKNILRHIADNKLLIDSDKHFEGALSSFFVVDIAIGSCRCSRAL